MASIDLKSSNSSILLGAINGLLFAIAYQPLKDAYVRYLWEIKPAQYTYVTLPEIYLVTKNSGEWWVWILLFIVASYSLHRYWPRKTNSSILLWLSVALVAIGVPVAGLYLIHIGFFVYGFVYAQFYTDCVTMSHTNVPVCGPPIYSHYLFRELNDVKFEIVLLAIALLLNVIFGSLVGKLANRFRTEHV
jgi:hypothetical protein